MDQRLALLLGLLTELKRIIVNPLGFVAAFFLQTQGFTANGLKILEGLLVGFMLLCMLAELNSIGLDLLNLLLGLLPACFQSLSVLTLQLNRFLLQLLASLQAFLFQLLATGELLLQGRLLCISCSNFAPC